MPAAGSTAIGSMRLLPSRCNCAKPGMRRPDFCWTASGFAVSLIAGHPSLSQTSLPPKLSGSLDENA